MLWVGFNDHCTTWTSVGVLSALLAACSGVDRSRIFDVQIETETDVHERAGVVPESLR
jgi:hypothetical protein